MLVFDIELRKILDTPPTKPHGPHYWQIKLTERVPFGPVTVAVFVPSNMTMTVALFWRRHMGQHAAWAAIDTIWTADLVVFRRRGD